VRVCHIGNRTQEVMRGYLGVAIMLTVMSMNFIGDWLRDRWDPRLTQLL